MDFVYIEKTGNISLNFENAKETGNEFGQLIQKNAQGLEEIAVTDILDFIAQDTEHQQFSGEVYTLSLSDGTALDDFNADFFSEAATDIEGEGVEYGNGKITLINSFDAVKITFAANHTTLELTLQNYTKPIPPIAYAFHGVGVTASISEILASAGIVSSYYSTTLSDEEAVSVEEDTLTTLSFFDEVTLTLTLEDESAVTVILTNPEFIAANQLVSSEAGSYAPTTELAAGAELKVKEAEENEAVTEQAKAELGEDAHVKFYDLSIVDAEGNKIDTGATVTLNLGIALDVPEDKLVKVSGFVYHVTDEGVELLDADFKLDNNGIASVTFSTDGFSLFGIAYTVDFVASEVSAAWSWPGQGSYSIADILNEIGVTGTVESVTLTRTVDAGGAENALYLSEDRTRIISEAAFLDTFELKIIVDGAIYTFTVTDTLGSDWYDLGNSGNTLATIVLSGLDEHTTQEINGTGTFRVRINYQVKDNLPAATTDAYLHSASDLGITNGADSYYAWYIDITNLANHSIIDANHLLQGWTEIYENDTEVGRFCVVQENGNYYIKLATTKDQVSGKSEIDGFLDLNVQVTQNTIHNEGFVDIDVPGQTDIKVKFKTTETETIDKDTANGQRYYDFYPSAYDENGYFYLDYTVELTEPAQVSSLSMRDIFIDSQGQEYVPGSVTITETKKTFTRTTGYNYNGTTYSNVNRGNWTDANSDQVLHTASGLSFDGNGEINILSALGTSSTVYNVTEGAATTSGGDWYTRVDTKEQSFYTVTYRTRIHRADIESIADLYGGSVYLKNKAQIVLNGAPTTSSDIVTVQLHPNDYPNGTKYSTSDYNGQQAANHTTRNENGKYEITWTSEIREPVALTRLSFRDTIGSPALFKAGSLKLWDEAGNEIPIVNPSALYVAPDSKSFTFDLAAAVGGATEANKKYLVTYATEVDPVDVPSVTSVRNTVTWVVDGEDKEPVRPVVNLVPANYVDHTKRVDYTRIVEGDSGYLATWTIEINEPMDSTLATLTDTYDNRLTLVAGSFKLYVNNVEQSSVPAVTDGASSQEGMRQFTMDIGPITKDTTYKIVYQTTCATRDQYLYNHSKFNLDDGFETNDKEAYVIYEKGTYTDGWKTSDPSSGANVLFDTDEDTKTIHYTVSINQPISASTAVLTERYSANQTMDFEHATITVGSGAPITVNLNDYIKAGTTAVTEDGVTTVQFDVIAALRAATGDPAAIIEANTPYTISYDGTVNLTQGVVNHVSNDASWHFEGRNEPGDHPGGGTGETYTPKGFNPGTKDVYYQGASMNGKTLALTEDYFPLTLSYRIHIYEQAHATTVTLQDSFNSPQVLDTGSFKLTIDGGTPMTIPTSLITSTATTFAIDLQAVLAYLHDNVDSSVARTFQAETNYDITYDTTVPQADFNAAVGSPNGLVNSAVWIFNNSPQQEVTTRVDIVENQMSKTSTPASGSAAAPAPVTPSATSSDDPTKIHMVVKVKNPGNADLTDKEIKDVMTITPALDNVQHVFSIDYDSIRLSGTYTEYENSEDHTGTVKTLDNTQKPEVYQDYSGFRVPLTLHNYLKKFNGSEYTVEYDVLVLDEETALTTYHLSGTYVLKNRATFGDFSAETYHEVTYDPGTYTSNKVCLGYNAETGEAWWDYTITSEKGIFPVGYSITEENLGWGVTLDAAKTAHNMTVDFSQNLTLYRDNINGNFDGIRHSTDKIEFTKNVSCHTLRIIFKTKVDSAYQYNENTSFYVYNQSQLLDDDGRQLTHDDAYNDMTIEKTYTRVDGRDIYWNVRISSPSDYTFTNWKLVETKYGIGTSLEAAKTNGGLTVDWDSVTVTPVGAGSSANWALSGGDVVFYELRGTVDVTIKTTASKDLYGTNYVYNKAMLQGTNRDVKLADDDDHVIQIENVPVDKTNGGDKYNVDPATVDQIFTIKINKERAFYDPDSRFSLEDTLPSGMELVSATAELYKKDANGVETTRSVAIIPAADGRSFTYNSEASDTLSECNYELRYHLRFTSDQVAVINAGHDDTTTYNFRNTVSLWKTDRPAITSEATSQFSFTYDDFVDKKDVSGQVLPGDTISYQIKVNERQMKLSDEGYLILEDILPQDTELVVNSVKVVRGDGQAFTAEQKANIEIGYEGLTRKLRIKLPDEVFCIVKYNVRSEELHPDGYTFKNTVTLIGRRAWEDTETTQHVVRNHSASQTSFTTGFVIRKRDGSNITKTLSGAKFQLYKAVMKTTGTTLNDYYASDTAELGYIAPSAAKVEELQTAMPGTYHSMNGEHLEIDHWEFVREGETNDAGILYFDNLQLRTLYYVVEVEPPLDENGRPYSMGSNASTYHFILFDPDITEEYDGYYEDRVYKLDDALSAVNGIIIDTRKEASIYTATNTKKVDVPVKKVWLGKEGANNEGPSIVVRLYRDGVAMEPQADYEKIITAELNWVYTYRDLPAGYEDASGNYVEYVYTAQEVGYINDQGQKVYGEIPHYVNVSNDGSGLTITNLKVTPETVTVVKNWVDDDNSGYTRPAAINVTLYQYSAAKGFAVVYDDLYGPSGVTEGKVQLNAGNSWSYVWEDLPAKGEYNLWGDNVGLVSYYLVEEVVSDYTTTYSTSASAVTIQAKEDKNATAETITAYPADENNLITVTNTLTKPGSLTIEKIWQGDDAAEITPAQKNAVTFTVTRVDTDPEETIATLTYAQVYEASADHKYTINNLPFGTYRVVESAPPEAGGFQVITTTVIDNRGTNTVTLTGQDAVATITNKYVGTGSLKLIKTVTTPSGVTLTDEQINNIYSHISFLVTGPNNYRITVPNETYSFQGAGADRYIEILNLAADSVYTVYEFVSNEDPDYSRVTTYTVTSADPNVTSNKVTVPANGQGEITVNNHYDKKGHLTITKTFAGIATPDLGDLAAVTFHITSSVADFDEMTVSMADSGWEWDASGSKYTYTIKELEAGSYTVVETHGKDVANYTCATTYEVDGTSTNTAAVAYHTTGTVNVTNTYTEMVKLKLKKLFSYKDTAELTAEQKALIIFTVTGPSGYSRTLTFAQFDENGEYLIENLEAGTYTVVEDASASLPGSRVVVKTTYQVNTESTTTTDQAVIGIDPGTTGTVTVTNRYEAKGLRVTKLWKNVDGSTKTPDPDTTIYYKILYKSDKQYNNIGAVSYDRSMDEGRYTSGNVFHLTFDGTSWSTDTFDISGLTMFDHDTNTNVPTSAVYVVETDDSGNTLTTENSDRIITYIYDEAGVNTAQQMPVGYNGAVTIVNQDRLPFKVTKSWLDADGNEKTAPESPVYFVLIRNDGTNDNWIYQSTNPNTPFQLAYNSSTHEWEEKVFTTLPRGANDSYYVLETNSAAQAVSDVRYEVTYLDKDGNPVSSSSRIAADDLAGNTVTITNQDQATFQVTKTWLDVDGNPRDDLANGETIRYIILYDTYQRLNGGYSADGHYTSSDSIFTLHYDRSSNTWSTDTFVLPTDGAWASKQFHIQEIKKDSETYLPENNSTFTVTYQYSDGTANTNQYVSGGASGSVTITNQDRRPLTVTKKLLDEYGEEVTPVEGKKFYFKLQKKHETYSEDVSNGTLEYTNGKWSEVSFPGLSVPTNNDYIYIVKETDSNWNETDTFYSIQYSISYVDENNNPISYTVGSGNTITDPEGRKIVIVNKPKTSETLGKIQVKKVWKGCDGDTLTDNAGKSATIQLYKVSKAYPKQGQPVTITVKTAWNSTISSVGAEAGIVVGDKVELYVEYNWTNGCSGAAINGNSIPLETIKENGNDKGYKFTFTATDTDVIIVIQGNFDNKRTTVNRTPANTTPDRVDTIPSTPDDKEDIVLNASNNFAWQGNLKTLVGNDFADYDYYFKEIAPATGYEISYSVTNASDPTISGRIGAGTTVTITNKEPAPGSLKITKAVTVNGTTPTDANKALTTGNYVFRIKDSSNQEVTDKSPVTVLFQEGRVTTYQVGTGQVENVQNGTNVQSIIVDGLNPGTYTVSEDANTNGMTLVGNNNISVTVTAGDTTAAQANASFTNNINTGDLIISKVTVGTSEADADDEFTFEVTLTAPTDVTLAGSYAAEKKDADNNITTTTASVNNEGKITNIKLKAGENYTIKGLPVGTGYTVAESEHAKYTSSIPTATGTIADTASSTVTVTATNTLKPGSLMITKIVNVNGATTTTTDADGDYIFTVTGPAGASSTVTKYVLIHVTNGVAVYHKVADANTEAAWTAATQVDAGTAIVNGLAVGDYVITESAVTGMTVTSITGGKLTGGSNDADLTNRTITVHVSAGEDTPTDGSEATATYTNNKDTVGSVEVTKTFSFPSGSNLTVPPEFKVTATWTIEGTNYSAELTTSSPDQTVTITDPDTQVVTTTDFTVSAVSGTNPYTWTIRNLPIGTRVTFEESGYGIAGYNVTSTVSVNGSTAAPGTSGTATPSATDPLPDTAKVAFTNSYQAGVELPATGGSGTLPYTLTGLTLLLGAALWLFLRRRREQN